MNIIDKDISIVSQSEFFIKYASNIEELRFEEIANTVYFSNKEEGIVFIFKNNILTTIHFYGSNHEEYNTYKGELPLDIDFTLSKNKIEEKFGKFEIRRGGGEVLPILGKANDWIMFLIDKNLYRFEFKYDKIYLVTLSNQYKGILA